MWSCKTKVWRRLAPALPLGARFFWGAIHRGTPFEVFHIHYGPRPFRKWQKCRSGTKEHPTNHEAAHSQEHPQPPTRSCGCGESRAKRGRSAVRRAAMGRSTVLCWATPLLAETQLPFLLFFQAEDGIRDAQESRGLGDVYKRQTLKVPLKGVYGHLKDQMAEMRSCNAEL